ncbi:hypothetical protein DV737_g51, partial [Chaetothyriales sp. CBS 132003]
MAGLPLSIRVAQTWKSIGGRSICQSCARSRRFLSTQTSHGSNDAIAELELEPESSLTAGSSAVDPSAYDPVAKARERPKQLPASRYQFRPPKYDRGPLHPHQPPHPSDPASREFIPGPFSTPRLQHSYRNTIAADFMTLCYQHVPPGFRAPAKTARLRTWEGDSPYFKNRPRRGPRGGDVLRLLRKPITFRNIPQVERVTIHSFVQEATRGGSAPIHVAGLLLQQITNKRVTVHKAKTSENKWHLVAGKPVSLTAELRGEDMYHFLSKLITLVLPKIKDWRGIRATTGDSSGNLTFGLEPETVALFPEVEVNYDTYPPRLIPGMHVTIHTSASCDKDARLLLQQMGLPFYGRISD